MNSRSSSKWGIAILILSQCAVSTTDAVTLWHNQKDNFKDYYQRKFHGSSGMFGDSTTASGSGSPLNVRGGDTASSCDSTTASSITATKRQKQHRSPRFSILSKRQPIIPIDCCTDCSSCMSISSLETYNCHDALSSIPRGGHLHHTHDGSSSATSAANVLADTLLDNSSNSASELITTTPYGIPLNIWKIIFQAMLTTINVVCWLLPLKSKKISENKLGLSIANAFSGGVFLSLAFGHLIPECVEGFHGVKSSNSAAGSILSNEALPYMIVLSGYLLIFFVEKVAFDAHDIMHEMESGGGSGGASQEGHSHKKVDKKKNGAPPSLTTKESSGFTGSSAVILLGALAVHSILEMTALGLADTFGDSALLSLSIALHQPAESIALLVAFLKSGMPKPQIVQFLSVFSCMGPIGVAIGMAGKLLYVWCSSVKCIYNF